MKQKPYGDLQSVEKENQQRLQEIDELKSLMKQIRCACAEAEKQATKTKDACFTKKASTFKATLSGLQQALTTLQDKCKTKDMMIDAMTRELNTRAGSGVYDKLLQNLTKCDDVPVPDYTRSEISNALQRPENVPKCVDPYPMQVTLVRRISPDSLLVKWKAPDSIAVTGYEIFVDDAFKTRVHSACRTSSVLDTLELRKNVTICIYAITDNGKCIPPATAVYQVE